MTNQQTLEEVSSQEQPVSARKAEANRQNALKSTGPKTSRGKAYSRRNSLKHGLFARQLSKDFALQREDAHEFQNLADQLQQEYQPVGMAEELEVERVAVCWWRLKRAWRFENAQIIFAQANIGLRAGATHERLMAQHQTLTLVLQSAEKEIEASGEISSELQEKMFAADPSFRERWAQFQEGVNQRYEEIVAELQKTGELSPVLTRFLHSGPDAEAERASVIALLTTKVALIYLESRPKREFEPAFNLACDRQAIPDQDIMDQILRYESAIERELGHALDRLERLQRRRQGETVPPPVSVRLTR
jgi:hypothetical protein